uniref:DNA-directed RNA polymerase n=1 Tax=Ciona savignyi TaxID=51511 RepID=H2Y632_CIOSA
TELLHKMWETKLLAAFNQLKSTERDKFNKYAQRRSSGVFPFLCALPDDVFVDIIMTSMKSLPSSGNIAFVLCCQLGQEVYSRYVISQRHERGYYSELSNIYSKYMEIYTNDRCNLSPRHLWTQLQKELGYINHRDPISPWQNLWIFTVGFKLLEVMVSTLTFDLHRPGGTLRNIPAVFNTYKVYGGKMYGMTIPHPAYVDLMKMAKNDFEFETSILPMVVPPLPWINPGQGGFLVAPTKLIRSYHDVIGRDDDMVEQANVAAVTDALNILGSVGWRINQRVLDVQLHLFRNKGNLTSSFSLAIPPPATEAPVTPDLSGLGELPSSEQRALYEAARTSKKLRSEMSSLHADSLYKLSIANHYRDRIIWFPHNLDFRGRTYPVPRHLNYMGSDVSRSLFLFADGKPLGGSGLDWMKIHLINLTGTKKKEGVQARLDYANEVMEEILDSADHPLEGRGWWRLSDEPWQTLAVCMALADAVRSRCPQEYVCHLPIYQDGSCNGLQHYAALGRDSLGAQQVNLAPSSVPQDIYSGVADKVEERRALDAAKGLEIAKILEGFVTRQVIKQTVMTTVYGVTRYGGSLQVQRQLLYLDDFPKKHVGKASSYLQLSQKWFTDLARCVSRGGDSLEWETPLGLLVTQPYLNTEIHRMDSQVQRMSYARTTPTPNTRKQSNAFPPNFIHSLDSTHMMLTALYCHRAGVKFSAVHDCYWTHACDVDNMNIICRDQFVKLHSQPILEQLAAHLHKFLPSHKADSAVITSEQPLLRDLLNNIPPKGDFDLTEVNKSVFFFS